MPNRSGRSDPPDTPRTVVADELRADARRNRDRILDVAREAFAEDGLAVSTNEIARRAGVGVATLFRRFPTRDDLVAAVFADRMTAYRSAVTEALEDPDPWNGFGRYLERVCAMQVCDRGFADVLTRWFPAAPALRSQRDAVSVDFATLVARAKATGRLRADFAHQDLVIVLMANAGVVAAGGDIAAAASKRLVAHLLRSFDAHPGDATDRALPRPPSKRAVLAVLTDNRLP